MQSVAGLEQGVGGKLRCGAFKSRQMWRELIKFHSGHLTVRAAVNKEVYDGGRKGSDVRSEVREVGMRFGSFIRRRTCSQ